MKAYSLLFVVAAISVQAETQYGFELETRTLDDSFIDNSLLGYARHDFGSSEAGFGIGADVQAKSDDDYGSQLAALHIYRYKNEVVYGAVVGISEGDFNAEFVGGETRWSGERLNFDMRMIYWLHESKENSHSIDILAEYKLNDDWSAIVDYGHHSLFDNRLLVDDWMLGAKYNWNDNFSAQLMGGIVDNRRPLGDVTDSYAQLGFGVSYEFGQATKIRPVRTPFSRITLD